MNEHLRPEGPEYTSPGRQAWDRGDGLDSSSSSSRPEGPAHISPGREPWDTDGATSPLSRITAGILSYNRKDDLRRTIEAVLAIPGLRVMVIDNASTDGTREMLADEFGLDFSGGASVSQASRPGLEHVAPSGLEEGEEPRPSPRSQGLRPGLVYPGPSGLGDVAPLGLGDAGPSGLGDPGPSGLGDVARLGLGDAGLAGLGDSGPSGLDALSPSRPRVLSTRFPQLGCIALETNMGITARNIYFREVETEFLLSLDDDSWPRAEGDVRRMLEVMDGNARVASVCAECVHPVTGVAETAGIERFASAGSEETGYDVVNIAAGGSLLRLAAVRETQGYGAEFFWGREENDLAFQLLQRGWRVLYDPRARVWHALSPAGRRQYERLRFVTRNSFWLLWKYFPLAAALPVSLLYALRRLLPIVKDPRRATPVLRGFVEGYGGMRARRRLPEGIRRFTLRESWHLRGWFLKLLYE